MNIDLFEHNQTAYNTANDMLDSIGKAAVIHPTGTGKSMIAFKLVETYQDAQFLWLAPSAYIFHMQLENLQRILGDSETESLLENVTFVTYSKLMHDEDIQKLTKRINDSKSTSDYSKNMKLLERLKRVLEQADGPERIFSKHMLDKHGKYIVFCSGVEHMRNSNYIMIHMAIWILRQSMSVHPDLILVIGSAKREY